MDREQIRLQGDYLKLLENLEIDILNISHCLKESFSSYSYNDEVIKAIKTLVQSSDVNHQKAIEYNILKEKNEKIDKISKKILQLLVDEVKKYCKEIEEKIESIK